MFEFAQVVRIKESGLKYVDNIRTLYLVKEVLENGNLKLMAVEPSNGERAIVEVPGEFVRIISSAITQEEIERWTS